MTATENSDQQKTTAPCHVSQFLCNKSPWLVIVAGILQILTGMVMVALPYITSLAVTWAAGIMMLVLAFLILVQLFKSQTKRGLVWGILSIILLLIAGFYSINQTVFALMAWTFILGGYFLFMGITRLIVSFSLKGQKGFGWTLFNAIVSLILGILVFVLPFQSLGLIGLLVGIELIFSGWIMTTLGIAAKHLKKQICDCDTANT